MRFTSFALLALFSASAYAAGPFEGNWTARICQPGSSTCGEGHFVLYQDGDRICGDHTFSTGNAGRANEGGLGTVRGVVVAGVAVLSVRSGRNGAILLGRATLLGRRLQWTPLEGVKIGDPPGDDLILGELVLSKSAEPAKSPASFATCSLAPN